MYTEITDINVIKRAQSEIAKNLVRQFPYKERRNIGWPSGHFHANVRFAKNKGGNVSWWHSWNSEERGVIFNLFGSGSPGSSKTLLIDLQFNLPLVEFNRKHGGVILRAEGGRALLLGHRGIVTRGKSRVPRDVLLQEADVSPVTALSDVRPGKVDVLIVSPTTSRSLRHDIAKFATEVRRAARLVMGENYIPDSSGSKPQKARKTTRKSPLDAALKSYYDEFTGKTTFSRYSQVSMDCRHGDVVKALRRKLEGKGRHYKSVAMDFVVETDKKVFLYEVKTGAGTQSIYTGIGQLYFHSAALSREFPSKKIVRILVIPYEPSATHREQVCKELGIEIMTFNFVGQKVNI